MIKEIPTYICHRKNMHGFVKVKCSEVTKCAGIKGYQFEVRYMHFP